MMIYLYWFILYESINNVYVVIQAKLGVVKSDFNQQLASLHHWVIFDV